MPSASDRLPDGTKSYAILRSRFEAQVGAAVSSAELWPERAATTIRTVLAVAAVDPSTAHRLVAPATGRRGADVPAFNDAVDDLAARLRAGAPAAFDSERASRNLVHRIARQVCLHLETRPDESVTELAADLIVFALTPCVGLAEARRLAAQPIETS